MPRRQYVKLSKDSLKRLSTTSIELDVREHELADAIIAASDMENRLPELKRAVLRSRAALKEGKEAREALLRDSCEGNEESPRERKGPDDVPFSSDNPTNAQKRDGGTS